MASIIDMISIIYQFFKIELVFFVCSYCMSSFILCVIVVWRHCFFSDFSNLDQVPQNLTLLLDYPYSRWTSSSNCILFSFQKKKKSDAVCFHFPCIQLIAEAWDAGGLYQVGQFPHWNTWSEWNGQVSKLFTNYFIKFVM